MQFSPGVVTWQSVATVTLFTLRRPFEFVNEESPEVTNGDVKGKRTALASVLAAVVTEIDRSFHCAFSYCGRTIKPTRKLSPALRNPLLVRCTALFSSQDTVKAWLLIFKKNAGILKTLVPNRPVPSNECHRHRYHCRYRNYYHFFYNYNSLIYARSCLCLLLNFMRVRTRKNHALYEPLLFVCTFLHWMSIHLVS